MTTDRQPSTPAPHAGNDAAPNSTGIKVVIVGVGLAGITAAIECHRKGHSVIVLEKVSELKHDAGDGIMIAPNASKVMRQWGDELLAEIVLNRCDSTHVDMMDHNDNLIARQELPGKGEGIVTNRGKLVCLLFAHAKNRLGIDIRLGSRVTDYWEENGQAGVTVDDGERISGDCVVCADGVHGMSRKFVTKEEVTPQETGWATFRAHIQADAIANDEEAKWVLAGTESEDRTYAWFGDGLNVAMMTLKRGKEVVWMTTHKDCYGARETWNGGGQAKMEDALAAISHWPGKHRIEAVIRHTKPHKLVNHALIYRPPLRTWISEGGRTMLIGDSAHPYYPVVAQGGSQGIEDGAVLAIALSLAGKERVPLALQVVEKIRYPRATVIQLGSESFQATVLRSDWGKDESKRDEFRFPNPDWIFSHDCQSYAYQEFESVVEAIRDGKEYVPTNIPVDGVYRVENTYKRG
uniref:TqaH n=1 Tax=Penicillium aethiopicum TaxID=36650 RepID=F1CWE3_PENAE|nr:TqaH [Penicillium aethiopicum]